VDYGYPFAVVLMIAAAILPFVIFQMEEVAVAGSWRPSAGSV
jgi:hypothetical protein